MEYTIDAVDGDVTVPYSSYAMNRTVSFMYHTPITGGTIELKARPFGRSDFLPIEDSPAFSAEEEKTITLSYPVAELQVTQAGIIGGSLIFITIAEGEQK